jgi:hypothetical protein
LRPDFVANPEMTDATGGKPDRDKLSPQALTGGETDAQRIARELRAIDLVTALNREAAAADAPGRFSLTELMLVVTLLGVVLGLLRGFGVWGWLITFAGCIAWGNLIYPRWYHTEPRRQIVMFDCLWGLLMPLVCLAFGTIVLRDQGLEWRIEVRPLNLVAHCLSLWQMLFLGAWLVGRPWLKGFAGLFLGIWVAGMTFAALLGILLVVLAALSIAGGAIGMAMAVALMGFTTLFASYVLARRIRETIELFDETVLPFALLAIAGFISAIVLPLQIAGWLQPFMKPPPELF